MNYRYLKHKMRSLHGHVNWVKNIEYSRREQYLATSGFDGAVFLWDINRHSEDEVSHYRVAHWDRDQKYMYPKWTYNFNLHLNMWYWYQDICSNVKMNKKSPQTEVYIWRTKWPPRSLKAPDACVSNLSQNNYRVVVYFVAIRVARWL